MSNNTNGFAVISKNGRLGIIVDKSSPFIYVGLKGLDSTEHGYESDIAELHSEALEDAGLGLRRFREGDSFETLGTYSTIDAAIASVNELGCKKSGCKNDVLANALSKKYFTEEKIDELVDVIDEADGLVSDINELVTVLGKLNIKVSEARATLNTAVNSKCSKTTEANLDKLTKMVKFLKQTAPIDKVIEIAGTYTGDTKKYNPSEDLKDLIPAKKSKKDA
jgi:hypothetical protein